MDQQAELITIEAVINAPIEKVYEYWTSPLHIVKWNFASDDWICPDAKNDLRPDGIFSSRMEARDGSMGFNFLGRHTQVAPHHRIFSVLDDGRSLEVLFKQQGKTTKVTEQFEAEKTHPADLQRTGWQAILNNFKTYTESH